MRKGRNLLKDFPLPCGFHIERETEKRICCSISPRWPDTYTTIMKSVFGLALDILYLVLHLKLKSLRATPTIWQINLASI
jgi:hypothetical protein